jgi:metal-responsive CopG/Arc/MetJ family transcriptional regulator
MERVTVVIPSDLLDILDAYAERETRSRSQAVVLLLKAALGRASK